MEGRRLRWFTAVSILGKMCFIDEKFHGDVFLFCAALFPQNLQDLLNLPAILAAVFLYRSTKHVRHYDHF